MKKGMLGILLAVLLLSGCGRTGDGCLTEQTVTPELQTGEATQQTQPVTPEHSHQLAQQPQTVEDPVTGYCGNTLTTVYLGEEIYTFWGGDSVTLTDILINLDYKPEKVCRCLPEFTVDTEFKTGYGVNLTEGYVRCADGQADLTAQQVQCIQQIIEILQ